MKKIYAFIAFFIFLGLTGSVFAAKPVVNLHSASNITSNSATLSLSYTSDSPVSVIMFEYSTDPSFGSSVNNISGLNKSVNITGLTSNTIYYYRATVSNNDGPVTEPYSASYNFKTLNNGSTNSTYSETLGTESVTTSSMTLTGRVNTYGASGIAYYKLYSSNCSSLVTTTSSVSLNAQTGTQYVKTNVSGLTSNTTYCSELIATVNGVNYSGGKVTVQTSNSGTSGNSCVISSFTSDSTSLYQGNSTTLRWSTNNCTSASLTNIGTVSVNDSRSTGALYSTTSYTLTAYGNGSDTQTISIGVLPNNNNNNGNTNPQCYYDRTCYWNGTNWVYYNNNNNNNYNNQPSCYYSSQCYWNGYSWVYYNNNNYQNNNVNTYSGTYPSCYYDATCYWTGSTWMYNNGGNVNGNYAPYTYNPHTPYTGGPNYITKTVSGGVKTVYVDQPFTNYVPNNNVTYVGNNYGYDTNIMSRYNADYPNTTVRNGSLLTGSAGSAGQVTLIGLLIAIIIIMIIIYVVKSNSNNNSSH
jgi:hypothetical protein